MMIGDILGIDWRWIAGGIGGALSVVWVFVNNAANKRKARRQGAADQRAKDAAETHKRVERGRQALRDGRGDSPADRLRRNDGRW